MPDRVTDPALLAKLEASGKPGAEKPVTDPHLLARLEGGSSAPEDTRSPHALGPAASAVVRPIAQGVLGAINFIPDMATDVVNAIPGLGPKAQRPSDAWQNVIDKYTTKPQGTLNRAAEGVSTMLLSGGAAGVGKEALGLAGAAGKKVLSRITTRAAEQAHTAGYKLPPSYIGGQLSKTAQTMAGGPKVEKEMSKANEEVTDRLAKTELGLHPEHELDEHSLEALKTEAYQPYEEARQLGTIRADSQYVNDLTNAGGRFANRASSFAGSRFPGLDEAKMPYLQSQFDAGHAIDEIRMLRKQSRDNLRQYNPGANALGYTEREIANALENQLDRAAQASGRADLIDRLKAARIQLSKIAAVEDSLTAGGHVNGQDFARMLDKGMPLTGNLRLIAETAKNFPKAVQPITKQGESGLFSAVDYLLGGTGMVEHASGLAALPVARVATRAALGTKPAQALMMNRVRRAGAPGTVGKLGSAAATGAGIQWYENDGQ